MSDIQKFDVLAEHIKVLVVVDKSNNDLHNPYMLIWRVVNNIDALRDVRLKNTDFIFCFSNNLFSEFLYIRKLRLIF